MSKEPQKKARGLNKNKRLKGEQGFTLLEIMVAVSIIAIAFTTIFRMHSQTLKMVQTAKFYAVAPHLAQAKLSEIESDPGSFRDLSGNFEDSYSDYSWKSNVEEVVLNVLDEGANVVKKIDLSVNFGNEEYSLRLYVGD